MFLILASFLLASNAPLVVLDAPSVPEPRVTFVQEDEEIEDKRPEVKETLKQLAAHVKERGKEDQQAVAVIDRLVQEFDKSGPKDRKAIAAGVAKCLDAKRDLDPESEDMTIVLHAAAAVALGRMGPESVKDLISAIDDKQLKENLELQKYLILALGKTEDPKGVKTLTGLLKHHEPRMQAAGAEALASFTSLGQDDRKEIVYEMIKIMMALKSVVDTSPADQIARERWDTISGPIIGSLRILTGHDEGEPEAWQRWWNKNKKEDWGERS
ncbi:MAG: HEAT repeat domain-containing protein [Planctomycetota bacterium]